MPPERRPELLLVDIIERAEATLSAVKGLDEAGLRESDLHRSAMLWSLSIIGGAARRLPLEFCDAHTEVPWTRMIGFRNVVLHACEHIEASILWATIGQVRDVRDALLTILRSEFPLVAEAVAQRAAEEPS